MTKNANPKSVASPSPLQLDEQRDPDRRILITPRDEDRFSLTCSQAIEACKSHISRKVWFDELDTMLDEVNHWCMDNASQVHSAYAAARDGRVVIFVVPTSDTFDLALGTKLTELDLTIVQRYPLIPSETLQIPGKTAEALESFVDMEAAKVIYGQTSQPSGAMVAQP